MKKRKVTKTCKDNRPGDLAKLEKQAEKMAAEYASLTTVDINALSSEEIRNVIHELHAHQAELETQNEELRRAQADLDTSQARYFDLYNLAPVGYVTVCGKGIIRECNLTTANLLGTTRDNMVNRKFSNFIFKEDQDTYYLRRKELFDKRKPQTYELRMEKADGTSFWAQLEAIFEHNEGGAPVCNMTMSDITKRKQAEDFLIESNSLLEQRVEERTKKLQNEIKTGVWPSMDGSACRAGLSGRQIW